jgi:hypothetical protein
MDRRTMLETSAISALALAVLPTTARAQAALRLKPHGDAPEVIPIDCS